MDAIYHRTHLGDALLHALQKLCVAGELEGAEARRILADFDEVRREATIHDKVYFPHSKRNGFLVQYSPQDPPVPGDIQAGYSCRAISSFEARVATEGSKDAQAELLYAFLYNLLTIDLHAA